MERPESRSRVLALAGVFVVTMLGMALWVGVTVHRDASIDWPAGKRSIAREHPNPAVVPSVDTRTTLPAAPAAPVDRNATGRLHIHCVDAATGADLPGLTLVAGAEGDEERLLCTGVTDASGHVVARDIPVGTILVFSLRNPPHAQSFAAFHLAAGESKDVELRMGSGGRVTGRVVDDLQQPLPDAQVIVGNDYAPPFLKAEALSSTSKVAARTDTEGKYVVDHLASRPRGVRVDESGARPKYWDDVLIAARLGTALASTTAPLRAGECRTAEDIVLQRARTWRGRVVDASGRPVARALLSVNMQRMNQERLAMGVADGVVHVPGRPGFSLLSGETLTGPDGTFVLTSSVPLLYRARVIEESGPSHYVRLPALDPGAAANDIVLQLKAASVIALDLVDGVGAKARVPNLRIYPAGSRTRSASYWSTAPIKLAFTFDDGSVETAELRDDGTGGFVAQLGAPIELARSCSLSAEGWSRKSTQLVPRLTSGETLRMTLDEQPSVRIHVRIHGAAVALAGKEPFRFGMHACLLGADVLSAGKVECCGLGSRISIELEDGERDLVLPVESQRTFHVFTETSGNTEGKRIIDRGTCSPGSEPLSIEIDAGEILQGSAVDTSPTVDRGATEEKPITGSVRVTVIDARTGGPVLHPWLMLQKPDKQFACNPVRGLTVDNVIARDDIPVGVWKGNLCAQGYKPQQDLRVDVTQGATADLGQIVLQPLPSTRFVIEESDGTPLPAHAASIMLRSVDGSKHLGMGTLDHDDGSVSIFGDLPDRVLIRIGEDACALQWAEVAVDHKETIVKLSAWHDVDVWMSGAASDLRQSSVVLTVTCPSLGSATCAPGSVGFALTSVRPAEIDVPLGEPRLFRCRLGAGRYVVEGDSPLFRVTSRAFEIRDGDGLVRVDLESSE